MNEMKPEDLRAMAGRQAMPEESTQKQMTPIQEVIESLTTQAAGLHSAVEILENRLGPVLGEPSDHLEKGIPVGPPTAKLRHELAAIRDSLIRTHTQVDGIVDRLEL